jgi:SAM-dependent methyltransferase
MTADVVTYPPPSSAERIAPLEATHFWFVGRNRLFAHMVDRIRIRGHWCVGEIGFGTGHFAAELSKKGDHVVAVDASIDSALPVGPSFALGDATDLPWRNGSLDLVVARDVLEHCDDRRALDEAHRVLRPNGHLLLSVPAWPSLWSERDRVAGHLRRYTKRGLIKLIRAHSFEPVEVRGYPFLLFPLFVAARRGRKAGDADFRSEEIVHPVVNATLRTITAFEARLARSRHVRPPHGSSLIMLAVRK